MSVGVPAVNAEVGPMTAAAIRRLERELRDVRNQLGQVISNNTLTLPTGSTVVSGVASFNARMGTVVPALSDYDASQIDNDSSVSGATVKDALEALSASSPLTTKGDIWGYDSTDARIPVGADGEFVMADSADAQGVSYTVPVPFYEQAGEPTVSPERFAVWAKTGGSKVIVSFRCPDGAGGFKWYEFIRD